MNRQSIDIVNEILEECIMAYPVSSFVISLYKQYQQRGSLSKKQLQGLFGKASLITSLSPGKLATLEALIKKMPTRYKSEIPEPVADVKEANEEALLIAAILDRYPAHKRVLFFKAKLENNDLLSSLESAELKKFSRILEK